MDSAESNVLNKSHLEFKPRDTHQSQSTGWSEILGLPSSGRSSTVCKSQKVFCFVIIVVVFLFCVFFSFFDNCLFLQGTN